MSLPESFTTERLRAERLARDHSLALEGLHLDPLVMAELGGIRDREKTADYLARNLLHWSRYGFGVWMLWEIESGEFAGRGLLRHLDLDGADEVELGFALAKRFWGRGLATEIGERCVSMARNELGLGSLVGVTTLTNHASQRALAKLGMKREGEVSFDGTPCLVHRVRLSPRDHL